MKYIYCDESCHLENDGVDILVLGAIKIEEDLKRKVIEDIRLLKIKHQLSSWFEIKWTKVSAGKIEFYKELIDYFFDNEFLSFRGVVATGKTELDHGKYNNSDYDEWYYKMYYQLLDPFTPPSESYKIFIDIKDTRGGAKVNQLHEVLCNNKWDFNRNVIKDIKQVHSNESEILQLCDLLIGTLSFYNRGLCEISSSSSSKKELVQAVISRTGANLNESTKRYESKFNLFMWQPRKVK